MSIMCKKNSISAGEDSEAPLPADIRKVLAAAPKAKALWLGLTPLARRDFIMWIDQAKQSETRTRRIESVPSRLTSGKRRPCCYAMVPMNLYKTLGATPRAKAQWKELSPIERRDFASWIDAAKDPAAHVRRIKEAGEILARGKRHP